MVVVVSNGRSELISLRGKVEGRKVAQKMRWQGMNTFVFQAFQISLSFLNVSKMRTNSSFRASCSKYAS